MALFLGPRPVRIGGSHRSRFSARGNHLASNGNLELTRLFLGHKADVNKISADASGNVKNGPVSFGNLTALHFAAGIGSAEEVKLLLDAGAPVDPRDIHFLLAKQQPAGNWAGFRPLLRFVVMALAPSIADVTRNIELRPMRDRRLSKMLLFCMGRTGLVNNIYLC